MQRINAVDALMQLTIRSALREMVQPDVRLVLLHAQTSGDTIVDFVVERQYDEREY